MGVFSMVERQENMEASSEPSAIIRHFFRCVGPSSASSAAEDRRRVIAAAEPALPYPLWRIKLPYLSAAITRCRRTGCHRPCRGRVAADGPSAP